MFVCVSLNSSNNVADRKIKKSWCLCVHKGVCACVWLHVAPSGTEVVSPYSCLMTLLPFPACSSSHVLSALFWLVGAYLVPYLILLILIGIPLFFLELAVGQRIRRGSIGVWNYISPRLGGIGFASCVVSLTLGPDSSLL